MANNISLGSSQADVIYLGNTSVDKIMLGNEEVYPLENDIIFVGSSVHSNQGNSTGNDIHIPLNTLTGGIDTQASTDDIIIITHSIGTSSDEYPPTVKLPDGWTGITHGDSWDDTRNICQSMFYKVVVGNPESGIHLDPGGNTDMGVVTTVFVFRHVDPDFPLDVIPKVDIARNTSSPNPPAITPVTEGSIILVSGSAVHPYDTETFSSPDLDNFVSAGYNSVYEATVGTGMKVWTSGAFDPAAFTFSSGSTGRNTSSSIALRKKGAPKVPKISLLGKYFNHTSTDLSLYTYPNINIGEASANDYIIVALAGAISWNSDSPTLKINGNNMTLLNHNANRAGIGTIVFYHAAYYYYKITEDLNNATLEVLWPDLARYNAIGLWCVRNADITTALTTANTGDKMDLSINTYDNGFMSAIAIDAGEGKPYTWWEGVIWYDYTEFNYIDAASAITQFGETPKLVKAHLEDGDTGQGMSFSVGPITI